MSDDDLGGAFIITAISLVSWLFFFQLVDSDLSTPNRIFWAVVAGIRGGPSSSTTLRPC